MTTYQELHKTIQEKTFRLTIFEHITQYLDRTFCTDGPEKMVMQTDDDRAVPDWALEAVVEDLLNQAKQTSDELKVLMASEVAVVSPQAQAPIQPQAQAPAPVPQGTPTPAPEDLKKAKKKG